MALSFAVRLGLLSYMNDALLQHVQSNVGFFLGHYQRRADPDRARPATQGTESGGTRAFAE
jgi:hypothetical protein